MTRAKSRTIEEHLQQRVGMMRQWLNEDRIQDADRFVTNEMLLHWLKLDELETLIKESKPKKVCHFATENGVPFDTDEDIAYNKALNDYEANLLKILQ